MSKIILFLFVNIVLMSCVNRNTDYRIVGKDGKVLYINRQRTEFNKEKLREQQQKKADSISIVGSKNNDKNSQSANNKSNNTNGNEKKIDKNLVLESSAYSLRSVVDTVVKNEDINDIAKIVEKNQDEKTIKDFDIPEYYFNSSKYNAKKISNSTNQNSVNNLQIINLANNKKNERNNIKFSSGIFSGNEEKIIRIAKNNVNQLNNKQPVSNDEEKIMFSNTNLLKEKYSNSNDLIILSSAIINGQQTKINSANDKLKENKVKQNNSKIVGGKNERLTNDTTVVSSSTGRVRVLPTNISSVRSLSSDSSSVSSTSSTTSNGLTVKSNKSAKKVKVLANDGLNSKKYYIQIGSFKQANKAEKLLNDFIFVGTSRKVVPVEVNNNKMYRAVIGTFNTKNEAEKEMKKLLDRGHSDVFVFYKK